MKTDFKCRIENQVMLFNAVHDMVMAKARLKAGGLSKMDIRDLSDVIIDCEEILHHAPYFPDAGEA